MTGIRASERKRGQVAAWRELSSTDPDFTVRTAAPRVGHIGIDRGLRGWARIEQGDADEHARE